MKNGILRIQNLLSRVGRDQKGITGLETAIVLIAFVVVASVFAYAVITTGLFSSEKAKSSAQSGVAAAKATMSAKGSMVLSEAQATGVDAGLGSAALLTQAAGSFITEGVVSGDAIRNTTDGSSCTADVVAALTITCVSPPGLTGGTEDDWDVGDAFQVDMDQVGTIKFKVTPSPGAEPFSLASANTVVTFIDDNNDENATYIAAFPDPLVDDAYWTHSWLVGTGPAIEVGEVVEFTVSVKNLTTPLSTNAKFSVEVIPQTGAALALQRTTPLEMTLVMDVR